VVQCPWGIGPRRLFVLDRDELIAANHGIIRKNFCIWTITGGVNRQN
jgi:hypothetical protein